MLRLRGITEQRLDHIVADYQKANLAPATRAVLRFTLKLVASDLSISREDMREASSEGLTDESLLEAILTAALSGLLCMLSTGVGAVPDFALHSIPPPEHFLTVPGDESPATDEKSGFNLYAPELNAGDFAPFVFFREQFSSVPSVFLAQTRRPDILEAEAHAIRALLVAGDHLSRTQKERLLLAGEHSKADLGASDGALLNFTKKLSVDAEEFSISDIQALRERGFTEHQILEAVATRALACFFNVLQAGLGSTPDFGARWTCKPAELKTVAKKAHLSASDQRHTGIIRPVDPDGECVARVQRGDLDAFEELMNRHSQRVYRTLVGILGDQDDARDAMQDTFLKVFQHLARFEGRSKFSTWLVSIATNTGIQRLREQRPMESLDETGSDEEGFRPRQVQAWTDDPEQLYSEAEMRSLIESGLMKLPAKYRVVVMLRDIEQLSAEDAAVVLGLGIPALKARLLRGRLMLREALAPRFISSGRKGSMKGAII